MDKRKSAKLNNRGAAIIIAVVAIAFISIITTVLLYLANLNYQMKSTDFRTKESFYGAEVPLEEIRTIFVVDAIGAAQEAYEECILHYSNLNKEQRYAQFQNSFFQKIQDTWSTRTVDPAVPTVTWNWVYGISNQLAGSAHASQYHVLKAALWYDGECHDPAKADCECAYHIIIDDSVVTNDAERLKVETKTIDGKSYVRLNFKGIKVIYTTSSGFSSIISTEYCIGVPDVEWKIDKCDDSWDVTDATETIERKKIDFATYVTYMNYKKQ